MKKTINVLKNVVNAVLCMISMLSVTTLDTYAQDYKRVGNRFIVVSSGMSRDTLETQYTIEVGKEEKPIVINRQTGRCYVWRVSKNGRGYRAYLKEEISKQIASELGIEYKPVQKRSK